jgi:hypothetical protein
VTSTSARRDQVAAVRAPAAPPAWAFALAVVVGVALRWWDLGGPALTADEQFTGVYASLPLGDVVTEVARIDIHGPLDYLTRAPFAGAHDGFWLRFPSALVATATLVFVWHWMRDRGWFGLEVVALTAVLPFFLLYGRTARMYVFLILFGAVAMRLAEAWGRDPRRWHPPALAGLLLLALLYDNTALLLAFGTFCLPALRRDADAWRWRAASVAAVVVWLVLWGPSLRSQTSNGFGQWIPLASYDTVTGEVGRLVTLFYPQFGILGIAAVGFGAWLLAREQPHLGRIVVAVTIVPVGVAVVASIWLHILLARSFASVSFGVVLALAGVLEAARRRGAPVLVAAVCAGIVLVGLSIGPALTFEEDTVAGLDALVQQTEPGDVVVMSPASLGHMVSWTLQAPVATTPTEGIGDDTVFVRAPVGDPTGRVWVLAAVGHPWAPDLEPCGDAPPIDAGAYELRCYRTR